MYFLRYRQRPNGWRWELYYNEECVASSFSKVYNQRRSAQRAAKTLLSPAILKRTKEEK